MRVSKLFVVCAALLLVTPVAFVGIAQESTGVAPKSTRANTYYEGWMSSAKTISSLTTGNGSRLDYYVMQPLVAVNWKGGLTPLLAESWEMQQGGKVWIFHLRKGVKWHDGAPFTAKDVVFSFNAYVNPKVGSRRYYWLSDVLGFDASRAGDSSSLAGVTALDDYTVRVELKSPLPLWVKLSATYIVIFPEHILGKVAPEDLIGDPFWSHRIGTGPFKWVKYVPEQYIMLERNEDYFLGAPKIQYLVLRFYTDAASQVAALERGEIDTTAYESTIISLDDINRLNALPNISVLTLSKGMPNFIRFNYNRPEWQDVRVRQAIRYAINVKGILASLSDGHGLPAYTVFPQAWAIPDGLNKYEYNPAKARELLKEAGWDPNRVVDFVYEYGDQYTQNLLLAIQSDLAAVGMKIQLRHVDAATSLNLWSSGKFDAGYYGFGLGLDPQIAQAVFEPSTWQSGGYDNPKAVELFKEAAQYNTNEQRQPFYYQIARIANEQQNCVWLWYAPRAIGFNRRVVGPYEHWKEQGVIYFNQPVYNEIQNWYIKQD